MFCFEKNVVPHGRDDQGPHQDHYLAIPAAAFIDNVYKCHVISEEKQVPHRQS